MQSRSNLLNYVSNNIYDINFHIVKLRIFTNEKCTKTREIELTVLLCQKVCVVLFFCGNYHDNDEGDIVRVWGLLLLLCSSQFSGL